MTILIAEDDLNNAILLTEWLKGDNVIIHHVTSGDDAVEFCKENPVDLVLMDIKMPNVDGYEATKQIKRNKPNLIVIAQTACATSREIEKINSSCFDAYILKPFNKEELLDKITKMTGSENMV